MANNGFAEKKIQLLLMIFINISVSLYICSTLDETIYCCWCCWWCWFCWCSLKLFIVVGVVGGVWFVNVVVWRLRQVLTGSRLGEGGYWSADGLSDRLAAVIMVWAPVMAGLAATMVVGVVAPLCKPLDTVLNTSWYWESQKKTLDALNNSAFHYNDHENDETLKCIYDVEE